MIRFSANLVIGVLCFPSITLLYTPLLSLLLDIKVQTRTLGGTLASYQNKVKTNSTFRPTAPRLMDQVREVLRYHHYGLKTEEAYVHWIKKFIYFHNKQHPKDMGKAEN